jgi:hypothetical protein
MKVRSVFILIILALVLAANAFAQSSAFNYQGSLKDQGATANGTYLLQVKLYDAPTGGNQVGATLSDVSVTAENGVFSADLDFGPAVFSGSDRYLEVSVRKTANEQYTLLTPRQKINSTPYATRAASTATADGFSGGLSGFSAAATK